MKLKSSGYVSYKNLLMNPYVATLVNAITLIIMAAWGYLAAENGSTTALIPVFFGVVLLLLSSGVKKQNKVVSHIVVILTVLIILSLYMPFQGALERGDNVALVRVLLMIAAGVVAMMAYIKNFMANRKAK